MCTPVPIATQYQTVTTLSPSTSFSESPTTIPPQLSTTTIVSCVQPIALNSSVCLSSTQIVSVSTIRDAQTSVIQIPFTLEIPITNTIPTNTIWSTCSSQQPQQQPTSQGPSNNGGSGVSSVLIVSTPDPLTSVVPSSSTLSNGQVSMVYQTVIYTQSPTEVYVPTTGFVHETQGVSSRNNTRLGVILGGSLGGVFGLFFIVAMLWWIRKRRIRFDDMFENTSNEDLRTQALERSKERKRFDIDEDPQPKPYHYGLIGSPPPVGYVQEPGNVIPPSVGFSTATSMPNMAFTVDSTPSSRRASTSVGSMAPFITPETNTRSRSPTVADSAPPSLEQRHGQSSPPPHITMSFGNWDEGIGSPVSIREPRTLKVVNDEDP